jgi:hypothetical protein
VLYVGETSRPSLDRRRACPVIFSWCSSNKIQEIKDEGEWEDAVYGGEGDLGGLSMAVGAGMILFGGLLVLRVL